MQDLLKKVDGSQGFYDALVLSNNDLKKLKKIVHGHFCSQIIKKYPELSDEIDDLEMNNYHELLANHPQIKHSEIWPKKNRILPDDLLNKFRRLDFFLKLEKILGPLKISNEENLYNEEVYWRLTRPGHKDVGPMHADNWFWELGHGNMPQGYRRLKIWISIFNESGKNGFRYVYGSHKKNWPYHGEERDGFVKPMIDICDDDLNITKFLSSSGEAIIFNDRLLHSGFSGGQKSRVSIECTLLVKNN